MAIKFLSNESIDGTLEVGSFTVSGSGIVAAVGMTLQVDAGGVNAITIDNVGTVTTSGYLKIPNYLFHDGNTDTFLQFGADTITLRGDSGITLDGPVTANETISITGNLTASRLFSGDGGNKTNPMIANGSDQNTGIFFPAADTMAFTAGDTEALRFAGANSTFAGNILMGNTVVNPASGFADQTGIGLKNSTTVPELQVSSDAAAMQLGRTTTGGDGQILGLRKEATVITSFGTNASQFYNLTSGQTGTVVMYSEGGGEVGLTVQSRTNRGKIRVADNDSNAYVVAEAGKAFYGTSANGDATNITVLTSGFVGIGTDSPLSPLTVKANTGGSALRFIGRSDGIAGIDFFNSTQTVGNYFQSNGTWIRSRADGGFHFSKGSTPITTDVDGFTIEGMNVGIGTDSPSNGKFVINQNSSAASFGGNVCQLFENFNTTDGQMMSIGFRNNNSVGTTAYIDAVAYDQSIGATDIRFSTYSGSAWSSNMVTFQHTGRVGIGTTSPSRKLVVAQSDVTEPSGIDANTSILIKNNTWSGIQMLATEATGNFITFGDNVNGFAGRIQYSHATNAMQFETVGAEAMRITSASRVAIGSTTASYGVLEIETESAVAYSPTVFTNGANIRLKSGGTATTGTTTGVSFGGGGACELYFGVEQQSSTLAHAIWQMYSGSAYQTNMRLSHDGTLTVKGDIVAYGSPSDKRLKENIKPIESALDKAMKLQGVTFDWKKSDSELNIKEDIGFIAQDVQKVVPELVRENEDGMLSMRHQGIAPILLEAIKELKAEIEELKNKPCNCK